MLETTGAKSIASGDDYSWCECCNGYYKPETEIWFCGRVSFLAARLWPASWIRNSLETQLHRQLIQVALRDPLTECPGKSIIELIN